MRFFSVLQNRALASYLGLAIGDALGATTEFMLGKEIQAKYGVHRNIIGGGWLRLKPGQVTDVTEMSLAMGQVLLEGRGMDLHKVALKFIGWMRSKPVDMDDTVRLGLQRIIATGQIEAEYCKSSAGNGAAIRNLPVILATLSNNYDFYDWSISQSHITHYYLDSDIGILILGDLTRRTILEGQSAPLQSLAKKWISRFPQFDCHPNKGDTSGQIIHTVKNVLDIFFNTVDFESCLIGIVNRGGDSDTNGAMAGMLAGAYYGLESIPKRWLNQLDPKVRKAIECQVNSLLERFPLSVRNRKSKRDNPFPIEYICSLLERTSQEDDQRNRRSFQRRR